MPSRVEVIALLAVAPVACGGHGAPARARVTARHGDGISYHVFVAAGRAAPASRVRQALSVLDSLRVARRPLS